MGGPDTKEEPPTLAPHECVQVPVTLDEGLLLVLENGCRFPILSFTLETSTE